MKKWYMILLLFLSFFGMFELGFYMGKKSDKSQNQKQQEEKSMVIPYDDYKYNKGHCAGC